MGLVSRRHTKAPCVARTLAITVLLGGPWGGGAGVPGYVRSEGLWVLGEAMWLPGAMMWHVRLPVALLVITLSVEARVETQLLSIPHSIPRSSSLMSNTGFLVLMPRRTSG